MFGTVRGLDLSIDLHTTTIAKPGQPHPLAGPRRAVEAGGALIPDQIVQIARQFPDQL